MIEDETTNRGWEAGIIKAALTEFLAARPRPKASKPKDTPGGLSVFMLAPCGYNQGSAVADRMASIRVTFGDDKLSDEAVRAAAQVKYALPKDLADARARVVAFVGFLKLLFGRDSIATEGNEEGLRLLRTRGRALGAEGVKDPTFFARFLHMLDRFFQQCCEQLLLSYERDPDEPFRALPQNFMRNSVRGAYAETVDSVHESRLTLPLELHALSTPPAPPVPERKDQDSHLVVSDI